MLFLYSGNIDFTLVIKVFHVEIKLLRIYMGCKIITGTLSVIIRSIEVRDM